MASIFEVEVVTADPNACPWLTVKAASAEEAIGYLWGCGFRPLHQPTELETPEHLKARIRQGAFAFHAVEGGEMTQAFGGQVFDMYSLPENASDLFTFAQDGRFWLVGFDDLEVVEEIDLLDAPDGLISVITEKEIGFAEERFLTAYNSREDIAKLIHDLRTANLSTLPVDVRLKCEDHIAQLVALLQR